MESNPQADSILQQLADPNGQLMTNLAIGVNTFDGDLPMIIHGIKALAPNPEIYINNIYTPFNKLDPFYPVLDQPINIMNDRINGLKQFEDYNIVDVYEQFASYSGDETLVNVNIGIAALDSYPTDAGHYLIYRAHLLPGTSLVYGVTIDKPVVDLLVGDIFTIKATLAPSDATNMKVTWTSSNEAVATVDSSGNITAIAEGTAEIKVTTEDGSFTDTCQVTVEKTDSVTDSTLNLAIGMDVFENAKESGQDLVFEGDGITWTFKGKDIKTPTELNLSLKTVSGDLRKLIKDKMKSLTGNEDDDVFIFSFNYDGVLPGPAEIKIFVGTYWANKTVKLRRYFPDKDTVGIVEGFE